MNAPRKRLKRGTRKRGPRTPNGTRRYDKEVFGALQWLRRYRDRHA